MRTERERFLAVALAVAGVLAAALASLAPARAEAASPHGVALIIWA